MPVTTILIVDDHAIVREGLKMVLDLEADLEVVGQASSGEEAMAIASELSPDLVLMDVLMEGTDGIYACRQIKNNLPDTRVLMLTSHSAAEAVEASLLAGASGYLLKNGGRAELLSAIRAMARGESLLVPSVTAGVLQRFGELTRPKQPAGQSRDEDILTGREKEVLALVAEGLTNREIASRLTISDNTARNHISHIMGKLDMTRRAQAAAYAARRGFVTPEI
ncbi:MAG: hypothetical protein BZY80_03605 [SAR202 cluster bacterium Io17-Chloro-G2]|nr:MAG: hypothetical protein BZY80_03605 [SAR202 cluster bacterium Io17-Chloro-G2]